MGDDEDEETEAREEADDRERFLEEVEAIEGYEETESEKWSGAWVAVDPENPDTQWIISDTHTHPWDEAEGEVGEEDAEE